MLLKTILNDCCKFKSFVYVQTHFSEDRKSIEVLIKPGRNGKPVCLICKVEAPIYDTNKTIRRFESVPWSNGKHQLTIFYMKYLADWCRHLLWKEVASQFHTSWHKVFVFVRWVV